MAKSVSDLFAKGFSSSDQRPPVQILRQVADRFETKVSGKLSARIVSTTSGTRFVHSFLLVAGELNYQTELFRLAHETVKFYPAKLSSAFLPGIKDIADEDGLLEALDYLFNTEKVNGLIGNLLSQL
jgi:hypothetical protein